METKALIKKLSLFATIILVIIGAGLIYWLYGVIYSIPPADNNKKTQIKIDYDLFTKIENPPAYGSQVTADEPGYGRANPFADFKEPPIAPTDPNAPTTTTPTDLKF